MHGLPRNVVLKIGPEVAPGENRLAALHRRSILRPHSRIDRFNDGESNAEPLARGNGATNGGGGQPRRFSDSALGDASFYGARAR